MIGEGMEIRHARPEDASACNDFYNSTYGRNRSAEQWKWEFITPNPAGVLPYVVAFDNGQLVGTQAYIPIKFIDENGVFLTAKSEETLVSAQMRGKNILNQMYDSLFEHARTRDVKSIWGFTPAEKAFLKLGFSIPCKTRMLVAPITPGGLSKLAAGNGSASRRLALALGGTGLALWRSIRSLGRRPRLAAGEALVRLEDAQAFSLAYSERFLAAWGGATILRDAAYMQWRLFDNPHLRATVMGFLVEGELAGHIAFAIDPNGVGRIVDVMAAHPGGRASDERLTRIMLVEAVARMRDQGAAVVTAMAVNDHPYEALIRRLSARLGFVDLNRGSAVVFHTNFGNAKRGSSHDDFANWFVTLLFTEGGLG